MIHCLTSEEMEKKACCHTSAGMLLHLAIQNAVFSMGEPVILALHNIAMCVRMITSLKVKAMWPWAVSPSSISAFL